MVLHDKPTTTPNNDVNKLTSWDDNLFDELVYSTNNEYSCLSGDIADLLNNPLIGEVHDHNHHYINDEDEDLNLIKSIFLPSRYSFQWTHKKGKIKPHQYWVYCEGKQQSYARLTLISEGFNWSNISKIFLYDNSIVFAESFKSNLPYIRVLRCNQYSGGFPYEDIVQTSKLQVVDYNLLKLQIKLKQDESLPIHPLQGSVNEIQMNYQACADGDMTNNEPFTYFLQFSFRNRVEGWFYLECSLTYDNQVIISSKSDIFMFNNPRMKKRKEFKNYSPSQIKFMQICSMDSNFDKDTWLELGSKLLYDKDTILNMFSLSNPIFLNPLKRKESPNIDYFFLDSFQQNKKPMLERNSNVLYEKNQKINSNLHYPPLSLPPSLSSSPSCHSSSSFSLSSPPYCKSNLFNSKTLLYQWLMPPDYVDLHNSTFNSILFPYQQFSTSKIIDTLHSIHSHYSSRKIEKIFTVYNSTVIELSLSDNFDPFGSSFLLANQFSLTVILSDSPTTLPPPLSLFFPIPTGLKSLMKSIPIGPSIENSKSPVSPSPIPTTPLLPTPSILSIPTVTSKISPTPSIISPSSSLMLPNAPTLIPSSPSLATATPSILSPPPLLPTSPIISPSILPPVPPLFNHPPVTSMAHSPQSSLVPSPLISTPTIIPSALATSKIPTLISTSAAPLIPQTPPIINIPCSTNLVSIKPPPTQVINASVIPSLCMIPPTISNQPIEYPFTVRNVVNSNIREVYVAERALDILKQKIAEEFNFPVHLIEKLEKSSTKAQLTTDKNLLYVKEFDVIDVYLFPPSNL